MTTLREATPKDFTAISHIWADELSRDWMGEERFVRDVLTDPYITSHSWWVVTQEKEVRGFIVLSRIFDQTCHVGAVAIHRPWQKKGLGRLLWNHVHVLLRDQGVKHVLFDGILPPVFIPGIDRIAYPGAWDWLNRVVGAQPLPSIMAMMRSLDDVMGLDDDSGGKSPAQDLMMGIIPPYMRAEAIQTAEEHFGPGWVRALRETWRADLTPSRVLGIFSNRHVLGLSVVGGYDQPLGRLGPIGVVNALRGQGWGGRLLDYTLRYMKTYDVPQAYFLHCDEGIPAYFMYLRHGFQVTRTFVPFSIEVI